MEMHKSIFFIHVSRIVVHSVGYAIGIQACKWKVEIFNDYLIIGDIHRLYYEWQ